MGREIAADLERIGAPVTRADLANYRAVPREPLALRLAGRTHYATPPPTQGLAALIILGIFERLGVRGAGSFAYVHALVEATKRAFAIRDDVCTDFDRLRHDIGSFLTPAALAREAAAIRMDRAAAFPAPPGKGDTVWMGAIDATRARGVLHPVDLLGIWFGLRPAADRHPHAEPRHGLLARRDGRSTRSSPAGGRRTRSLRRSSLSTTDA